MVSPENMHIVNIIQTGIIFRVGTYTHAITTKGIHEFEREEEGEYRNVWKTEKEGENVVSIITHKIVYWVFTVFFKL